jgi:hypothetical protein
MAYGSADDDWQIAPAQGHRRKFVEICRRFGYYVGDDALTAVSRTDRFNVIDLPRGWKADLIVRKSRDFSVTEFERRATHEVDGMRLTIASIDIRQIELVTRIADRIKRIHYIPDRYFLCPPPISASNILIVLYHAHTGVRCAHKKGGFERAKTQNTELGPSAECGTGELRTRAARQ